MGWRDDLPGEMKDNPAIQNFDSVGKLVDSFVELKAYQGNSIRVPGEDAGAEDQTKFVDKLLAAAPNVMLKPNPDDQQQTDEFWRVLGRPEQAGDYEIPSVDKPDGFELSEDGMAQMREYALDAGMTKTQFKKFATKVLEGQASEFTAAKDGLEGKWNELKKEWGMATEARVKKAVDVAVKLGAPNNIIEAAKSGTLDPAIMKWMYSVAESIGSEGNNVEGDQTQTGVTPAEAEAKIAEIYANKDHAYFKGDPTAMKRMMELVKQANPGMSADINDLRAGASM